MFTHDFLDFVSLFVDSEILACDVAQLEIDVSTDVILVGKHYQVTHQYHGATQYLSQIVKKLFRSTVWSSEHNAFTA